MNDLLDRIRGPVGSMIDLTIRRGAGGRVVDVGMRRATINLQIVSSRLDGTVGYIKLASFDEQAEAGVREAVRALSARAAGNRVCPRSPRQSRGTA